MFLNNWQNGVSPDRPTLRTGRGDFRLVKWLSGSNGHRLERFDSLIVNKGIWDLHLLSAIDFTFLEYIMYINMGGKRTTSQGLENTTRRHPRICPLSVRTLSVRKRARQRVREKTYQNAQDKRIREKTYENALPTGNARTRAFTLASSVDNSNNTTKKPGVLKMKETF